MMPTIIKRCSACRAIIGEFGLYEHAPIFCSNRCPKRSVPGVYVGSVEDIRRKNQRRLSRSNSWLLEAFKQYPPETWTYEVLQKLPQGSSPEKRRRAEQRYIERFRSWDPKRGFNIYPAVWFGNTPGVLAARERYAEQVRSRRLREAAMECEAHLTEEATAT
jgi:hypothetical protein